MTTIPHAAKPVTQTQVCTYYFKRRQQVMLPKSTTRVLHNLLAANVICATVPMEVGPPCCITLRAALNTYAPDRNKPPPEMIRQLQQFLNIWPGFDTGASAPPVGASGAVDIVLQGMR